MQQAMRQLKPGITHSTLPECPEQDHDHFLNQGGFSRSLVMHGCLICSHTTGMPQCKVAHPLLCSDMRGHPCKVSTRVGASAGTHVCHHDTAVMHTKEHLLQAGHFNLPPVLHCTLPLGVVQARLRAEAGEQKTSSDCSC